MILSVPMGRTSYDAAREQGTGRTSYIDAACMLACFFVVCDLVVGRGLLAGVAAPTYPQLLEYNLCMLGVPLLFMVAGARLLCRVDSWKVALWRIGRIALALTLFMLVQYAVYCAKNGAPFRLLRGLSCVYNDQLGLTVSYWVFYRYLSVLVTLPLLQRMMPYMRKRDVLYYVLVSVVLLRGIHGLGTFFPNIGPNTRFQTPVFYIYIGMMMLGYGIEKYGTYRRNAAWLAIFAALLLMGAAAYLMQLAGRIAPTRVARLESCEKTTVVLAAACLFYGIKCAFDGRPPSQRVQKALSGAAKLTLCVYLLAELLTGALAGVGAWLVMQTSPAVGTRLYALFVYACCMAAAFALTRLPLVKKLL